MYCTIYQTYFALKMPLPPAKEAGHDPLAGAHRTPPGMTTDWQPEFSRNLHPGLVSYKRKGPRRALSLGG